METHVQHQVEDYVLGLLSSEERGRIEQHAARCATCRKALQQERQLEQLVRRTLHQAAAPPGRHRHPPQSRPPRLLLSSFGTMPTASLASLALGALLLLLGWGWQLNQQPAILTQPTPTYLAITATHTDTPAATAVASPVSYLIPAAGTAVPTSYRQLDIIPTISRAPVATPVAALSPYTYTRSN